MTENENNFENKIKAITRHINNVRSNCVLLGERLLLNGESDFAKNLIANGFCHDNSKFSGIEFEYLHTSTKESEPEKFELALLQHISTNKHHPEFWGHINDMPRLFVAEFVCDITSRSQEFGENVNEWFDTKGIKKFQITKNTKKYKEVKDFLKLLLDEPFKKENK